MDGESTKRYEPASDQVLANWHFMMKRSMVRANEAGNNWDRRSERVNAYCDSRGFTSKQRAAYRRDDMPLKDAFATWQYFKDEVLRFGTMIQAELAMRGLME